MLACKNECPVLPVKTNTHTHTHHPPRRPRQVGKFDCTRLGNKDGWADPSDWRSIKSDTAFCKKHGILPLTQRLTHEPPIQYFPDDRPRNPRGDDPSPRLLPAAAPACGRWIAQHARGWVSRRVSVPPLLMPRGGVCGARMRRPHGHVGARRAGQVWPQPCGGPDRDAPGAPRLARPRTLRDSAARLGSSFGKRRPPPRLTASLPRRGWVARSPPCLVRRAGPRERPAADGGDQAQGHGRVGHPGRHGGRGRAGVCGSLFFAHPGGVDCTTHCFVRSIRRPLGGAGLGAAPGWRLSDRRALSSAGLTCCGVLPGPGIGDAEARVHGGGDGA